MRAYAAPAVRPLARWIAACLLIAPLSLLARPATPAQAAGGFDQILTRINTYRAWLGAPPMTRHPALDAAASAHARYYQLNYGDSSLAGMGLHYETPGKPGFTGEDMQDRVAAQGYSGSVNENIGLSGSMAASVEWFIGSINHRLPLLDPRYTHIGFGAVDDAGARIEVINVGAPTWGDTATPHWLVWPPAGTTGVGRSFWGEAPNPFPGASYPVGYPITLKYYGPGQVAFERATLTANGQEVPVYAVTGSGWLTRRTFMIAASAPLEPATAYTVTVEGSVDGTPFTRTWSFRTAASDDEPLLRGELPAGLATVNSAIQSIWYQTDWAVQAQLADRTWLWGPDTFAALEEDYAESPGGKRTVYYFDKSRMEITDPNADPRHPWFVTNGLLVRDMIMGAIQVGDNTFLPSQPAQIPLAGDPITRNPDAPTYASLHNLASTDAERGVERRLDQPVIETLAQDGTVASDASVGSDTLYGAYDDVTGHNIADVFWDWMTEQRWDWLYVLGHPISEPYWIRTLVDGSEQWVLVQAFERRVLTYTPSNPDGWEVEMGNVGRHYYEWRYQEPVPIS